VVTHVRYRIALTLMLIGVATGVWSCGSTKNASSAKNDSKGLGSHATMPHVNRDEKRSTSGPVTGYRVKRVGGCLSYYGVRLSNRNRLKPQVLFGGREVLDRNGRPMSVAVFEAISKRCQGNGRTAK
jgi:hypothetical protein